MRKTIYSLFKLFSFFFYLEKKIDGYQKYKNELENYTKKNTISNAMKVSVFLSPSFYNQFIRS